MSFMAAPPQDQQTERHLPGWRFRFQLATSLRPPSAMVFEVTVDVTDLIKNAPADSIVTKAVLSEIYGRTQANAEVIGQGSIASQIAARTYF
jgi:hypothetical protein